jgi:5'-methylthioadenosine phosphorylase
MNAGILFLCSGNSARSQMAEGFARAFLPPDVPVLSAGIAPAGLDPRAVAAMAELGVDISGHRSKHVSEIPLGGVGLVVTLCAGAAEACPVIPGARRDHWGIPDPALAGGPDLGLPAFRLARDQLLRHVWTLAESFPPEPAVAVVGGTGFYDLPGLSELRRLEVPTPFGPPSGAPAVGRLAGRKVAFLARHGEGHRFLPSEVNARANVYALKRLGVTRILSVSAVGSLREEIAPGQSVIPRQFIDRTAGRPGTFFGQGVVAHAGMADPVCGGLAGALEAAARAEGGGVHGRGTYVCIEGPQFSTRAESALWRSWGADVVGMTNLPEARLAREAEMCYATLALPTDYDCWRETTEAVNVADVLAVLQANVERAKRIVARAIAAVDPGAPCPCSRALDTALLTAPEAIEAKSRVRLHAILARRLRGPGA